MNFFHFALVASTLLAAVNALPTGAPEACCVNMNPAHGVDEQTGPAPFSVEYELQADGTYTVWLLANEGVAFRGFLLQARRLSTGTLVGGFTEIPEGAQYLNCLVADNAATHTDPSDKTDLSFTWDPRGADTEGVVFVSTFVQDTVTYWTFVKSTPL